MNCIVLDACALAYVFGGSQSCSNTCCNSKKQNLEHILSKVENHDYIIAYTRFISQEYNNTFGGQDFRQIWPVWENNGHIKMVPETDSLQIFKKLKPLNFRSKDYKFVIAAAQTQKRFIISEDSDFWEPKSKRNAHGHQEDIKNKNQGTVYKLLKKENITIKNILHAKECL